MPWNVPLAVAQLGAVSVAHDCVAGMQHAPLQVLAPHAVPTDVNVPPCEAHSGWVFWEQTPAMQHAPVGCGQGVVQSELSPR